MAGPVQPFAGSPLPNPPSTTTADPVMNDDSSLARNTATRATSSGLPIGLQISGAHFAESTVITLAHAYEQATEWHKRRPKLAG